MAITPTPQRVNLSNRFSDCIDIVERVSETNLTISGTVAQTAQPLPEGRYDVIATDDCYIGVGEDLSSAATGRGAALTTSNGYLVKANNGIPVWVPAASPGYKIGVIGTTGTLRIHRVE